MNYNNTKLSVNTNLSVRTEVALKALLKSPQKKIQENKIVKNIEENKQDKKKTDENFILCKACRNKITSYNDKINVNNLHNHTFANPNGIIFDIGCYKKAPGCILTGPLTDDFSWFTNYKWRVSVCASCLAHLGWVFISTNNNFFFGLIVNRLIETK